MSCSASPLTAGKGQVVGQPAFLSSLCPTFLPTPLAPQTFRFAVPEVQVQYSAHQLLEEGQGVSAIPNRSPKYQLWVEHGCNFQLEHCHPWASSQVEGMRPAVL